MHKKGITSQNELAKHLNISKTQLSTLLSGKFNPVKSNTCKLIEYLDAPVNEVIKQKDPKHN
nr:helix-turn-helix transcriptional regulator [Alkalibacillus aidingensis]